MLQWHDVKAVGRPRGSAVLARSDTCAVQILRVFDNAWGVQFHPELVRDTIEFWLGDPANDQCTVNWLGPANAVRKMIRKSNDITAEQFEMTAEIHSRLRRV